jgi:hypothetical protein
MACVQGDKKPDQLTPDERKLRDHYRDMAMAALKEGTAKGYNVLIFIEGDPDMDPLSPLPEFQNWLSEFKKSMKK